MFSNSLFFLNKNSMHAVIFTCVQIKIGFLRPYNELENLNQYWRSTFLSLNEKLLKASVQASNSHDVVETQRKLMDF